MTTLLCTVFRGDGVQREVLSSSPWYPEAGPVGRTQSCATEGLDQTSGNISLGRGGNSAGALCSKASDPSENCPEQLHTLFSNAHLLNLSFVVLRNTFNNFLSIPGKHV